MTLYLLHMYVYHELRSLQFFPMQVTSFYLWLTYQYSLISSAFPPKFSINLKRMGSYQYGQVPRSSTSNVIDKIS